MSFFAFMFSLFSLLLYVFIDVRLSHLNKDYLVLTYLLKMQVWISLGLRDNLYQA